VKRAAPNRRARRPCDDDEPGSFVREHMRLISVALFVGFALAVVGLIATTGSASTRRSEAMPADRALMLGFVTEYRRSRKPEDRARVIELVTASLNRIEPPLRWLLEQPAHPLVRPALRLAGDVRAHSVLPQVTVLAGVAGLKADAWSCIDRLEPLDPDRLRELFEAEDRESALAGIAVAAARPIPPALALATLLLHDDPAIRQAAFAALPDPLPADLVPLLLQLAGDAQIDRAALALQALGRTPIDAIAEEFLADQLTRAETPMLRGAIAALARCGRPLARSTRYALWNLLATDERREVRAEAYLCLERTGSYETAELASRNVEHEPFDRYFGARLRISAGDSRGLRDLIELLQELDGEAPDPFLRFATATLLGTIANKHASSTVAEWQAWLAEHPTHAARVLPLPPPGLGASEPAAPSR
jgi:hypothetical protein